MKVKIHPPSDLFGGEEFVVECSALELTLDNGESFRISGDDDDDHIRVWSNDNISMTAGCSNMIKIKNQKE